MYVVKDATAAAQHPELGDGYQAALVNFGYIASGVLTTSDAIENDRSPIDLKQVQHGRKPNSYSHVPTVLPLTQMSYRRSSIAL